MTQEELEQTNKLMREKLAGNESLIAELARNFAAAQSEIKGLYQFHADMQQLSEANDTLRLSRGNLLQIVQERDEKIGSLEVTLAVTKEDADLHIARCYKAEAENARYRAALEHIANNGHGVVAYFAREALGETA